MCIPWMNTNNGTEAADGARNCELTYSRVTSMRYAAGIFETLKANLTLCPINSDIPQLFVVLLATRNGRVNESVLRST